MKILKIVSIDQSGNKITAKLGIAGSAFQLEVDYLFNLDDTNEVEFFSLFLKDIRIGEETWSTLKNAIRLGIYKPNLQPLILDCSWEGHDFLPSLMEEIHSKLDFFGINRNTVAYIQMCVNQPKIYNDWADKMGLGENRIKLYSYWGTNTPIYENMKKIFMNQEGFDKYHNYIANNIFSKKPTMKRFLCLNNIIKPHRISIAEEIYKKYLNSTLLSFGKYQQSEINNDLNSNAYWFNDEKNLKERLLSFANNTPFILDAKTGDNQARSFVTFSFDPKLYRDTSISIVTESEMSSSGHLRITEKTFKPLGMFHPIILCGNKGSLRALREMGFRTFSSFIDESYDEIENGPERLDAIKLEINRLANLSEADFCEGILSIWPSIAHNAKHTNVMLKEIQKLELEKLYRTLRADFQELFDISRLKNEIILESNDLENSIIIDEKINVKYSNSLNDILVEQICEKPSFNDLFIHVETSKNIEAQSFNWPIGKSSYKIHIPNKDIISIRIGQFEAIEENGQIIYNNLWQAQIYRI